MFRIKDIGASSDDKLRLIKVNAWKTLPERIADEMMDP